MCRNLAFHPFSFQRWNGVSFIALHGNASGVGEFVAEEIVAFVVVFRADAQQTGERVGEPSRGDGTKLRFLNTFPKFGVLLAELWRSIDEEGDVYSGVIYVCSVTKESALLWFVNHIAVIGEIKDQCTLGRVVLYHLFEQTIGVAQGVEISRFLTFRIIRETLLHILGFEKVKGVGIALIVKNMATH